jgi:HSP20 family protein
MTATIFCLAAKAAIPANQYLVSRHRQQPAHNLHTGPEYGWHLQTRYPVHRSGGTSRAYLRHELSTEYHMNFALYDRSTAWAPSVDVREDAVQYTLQADLPGVDSKDIQVTADDGLLIIRGERRLERKEAKAGYERLERAAGQFLRRFSLPEDVRSDEIKARHSNGVLEIVIPKQPQVQPRQINIEVN